MSTIRERNANAIGKSDWTPCDFVLCNVDRNGPPLRSSGIARSFFGIHKNPDANGVAYALTHLPTGGRIAVGHDEETLMALAAEIARQMDWDSEDPEVISNRRTDELWFRLDAHERRVRRSGVNGQADVLTEGMLTGFLSESPAAKPEKAPGRSRAKRAPTKKATEDKGRIAASRG